MVSTEEMKIQNRYFSVQSRNIFLFSAPLIIRVLAHYIQKLCCLSQEAWLVSRLLFQIFIKSQYHKNCSSFFLQVIDRSGARYGKEILQENGCGLVGNATPTSVFIVLIVVAGKCIKSQNKFRPIWTCSDQFGQVSTNLDKLRQV